MTTGPTSSTVRCPACASTGARPIYTCRSVPTTSNLLMRSRRAALDWPTGDIALRACADCGFLFNSAYRPTAAAEAVGQYEATQTCSPTFGAFARRLAEGWVRRYGLVGKGALEIGCGQGEFIALLAALTGGPAWGVDPLVDPARAPAGPHLTWLRETFGPRHAALPFDFVICRHTLEHIADVRGFIDAIAAALSRRPGAVLAIEVPDTLRVVRETAFWDIYFEHCSYFTPSSLERLLRAAGLELLDLRLEYDEQYLIAEARGADQNSDKLPSTLSADLTAAELDDFTARVEQTVQAWRQTIRAAAGRGPVLLWGAGSKAVGFLTTLDLRDEVAAVVDINPAKQGSFLPGSGHEIVGPDRLPALRPATLLVMNPVYLDEIRRDLSGRGLSPQILALG